MAKWSTEGDLVDMTGTFINKGRGTRKMTRSIQLSASHEVLGETNPVGTLVLGFQLLELEEN